VLVEEVAKEASKSDESIGNKDVEDEFELGIREV